MFCCQIERDTTCLHGYATYCRYVRNAEIEGKFYQDQKQEHFDSKFEREILGLRRQDDGTAG